jgi:HK97 family phage major capsid protein
MQAGALTIPMETAEVPLARVASDPTPQWKGEHQPADISDMSFQRVFLRAKTLVAVVRASVELLEDAANVGTLIENSLAASLGLELDRAALRGGETAGSTEPTGIRWSSGVQLLNVNGGLAGFDDFATAYGMIQAVNGPADGVSVIMSTREAATIDAMKNGEGTPLVGPESWQRMRKFSTTQVPITLGGGTASEAYVAPFSELAVGMRTALTIEASRVASDSTQSAFRNLEVWIRAYLRADVLPMRETFFVVMHGITP